MLNLQLMEKAAALLNDDGVLEVADSVSNKTTITGGGIAMFGGFTMNEWAILVGLILGVAGFAADIWFKHQRLKLMRQARRNEIQNLDD